jgi:hypothetical protein
LNSDKKLTFRESSIAASSRHSIDNGPEGAISATIKSSDLNDQRGHAQGIVPQRSDEADQQGSTVPVPSDFDFGNILKSSPLPRRSLRVTRAARRAQTPLVDGGNSTRSDESADSGGKISNGKSIADDKYQVPKSDSRNDESEASIITEMTGGQKNTVRSKSANAEYSPKAQSKQAANTKATPVAAKNNQPRGTKKTTPSTQRLSDSRNRILRPQRKPKTLPDEVESSHPSTKAAGGSSSQNRGEVPASHKHASPLNFKPRATNIRRPKPPFFEDHLSEQQAEVGPSSSAKNPPDMDDQSKPNHGKLSLSPHKKTNSQRDGADRVATQNKRNTPDRSQPGPKRQKVNNGDKLTVAQGKLTTVEKIPPIPTANKPAISPVTISSDRDTTFTDMEDREMHQQPDPFHLVQVETSKGSGDFRVKKQYDIRTKGAPVAKDSFSSVDISSLMSLPQISPISVGHNGVTENEPEAIEIDTVGVYPLPRCLDDIEEGKEDGVDNDMTTHRPLQWSRVSNASIPSITEFAATYTRRDDEQNEKHGNIPLAEVRPPPLGDSLITGSRSERGKDPQTASRFLALFGPEALAEKLNQAGGNRHGIPDAGPPMPGKRKHPHADVEANRRRRTHMDPLDTNSSLHTRSVASPQGAARMPHGVATKKHQLAGAGPFVTGNQQHANPRLGFGTPPSLKASESLRDLEDTLHPKSMAYARRLAERPQQENIHTDAPKEADDTEPPRQTPIKALVSPIDPTRKRDTALRAPRGAVLKAVRDVTEVSDIDAFIFICEY